MPPYELTSDDQVLIQKLRAFRDAILEWTTTASPENQQHLRTSINRQLDEVREIVRVAGCSQTVVVSPPAITGRPISRIDPFSHIFQPVYGRPQIDFVCDMLDRAIGVIESGKYQERRSNLARTTSPVDSVSCPKVFLVHGHDESAKVSTARFLERLRLEAVVLHEQASSGQTIIEKIERYSEVAFAVVLLTPDDIGAERGRDDALRPRARQNVILELGFFMGKLGRSHVVALVNGDVETPSDYDGVVYISIDDGCAWQMVLARELKAAGLNVNLNDIT